jgi:uncharacterized membrane protein
MSSNRLTAKFYYMLYYGASIVMMLGLLGALVSFCAEGLYWVRFGAWPEWSFFTQPPAPTGLVGLDRILAALSKGPPSIQLAVLWFIGFLASWWFERKTIKANKKDG